MLSMITPCGIEAVGKKVSETAEAATGTRFSICALVANDVGEAGDKQRLVGSTAAAGASYFPLC